MGLPLVEKRDRITIAILALGGQGGGVLADWIIDLGNKNGFIAQGTSVPGVAQRTGSTVYYIEMVRRPPAGVERPPPVLALMPVPGDVDVVIASELMEAGRAILRGFVTEDRTTLIGSTHRIYAISEKSALGDGTGSSSRILDAARRRSSAFIGFDMDATAATAGSVISSVMLGALAGSGALPFERELFEAAIRLGGKAVDANLRGFSAGVSQASTTVIEWQAMATPPEPTTIDGRAIRGTIGILPLTVHPVAIEGARRLMDYQDRAYADLYLNRLAAICTLDNGWDNWKLTRQVAQHLALWMTYEDVIRVADLKVRATRSARVRNEVGLAREQMLTVTEYMHPSLQEVCETMPAWLGSAVLDRAWLRRPLERMFSRGRHVETTRLRWFLLLFCLAGLRWMRRSTLRHAREEARIMAWLALIENAAVRDIPFAAELATTQRVIKGYSDTFKRSLEGFETIMAAAPKLLGSPDAADRLRALRDAALADEEGHALRELLAENGL